MNPVSISSTYTWGELQRLCGYTSAGSSQLHPSVTSLIHTSQTITTPIKPKGPQALINAIRPNPNEAISKVFEDAKTEAAKRELVSAVDINGNAALHCAAANASISWEHIQTMVNLGADVHAKNSDGKTPLHLFFSCQFPPETHQRSIKVAHCLLLCASPSLEEWDTKIMDATKGSLSVKVITIIIKDYIGASCQDFLNRINMSSSLNTPTPSITELAIKSCVMRPSPPIEVIEDLLGAGADLQTPLAQSKDKAPGPSRHTVQDLATESIDRLSSAQKLLLLPSRQALNYHQNKRLEKVLNYKPVKDILSVLNKIRIQLLKAGHEMDYPTLHETTAHHIFNGTGCTIIDIRTYVESPGDIIENAIDKIIHLIEGHTIRQSEPYRGISNSICIENTRLTIYYQKSWKGLNSLTDAFHIQLDPKQPSIIAPPTGNVALMVEHREIDLLEKFKIDWLVTHMTLGYTMPNNFEVIIRANPCPVQLSVMYIHILRKSTLLSGYGIKMCQTLNFLTLVEIWTTSNPSQSYLQQIKEVAIAGNQDRTSFSMNIILLHITSNPEDLGDLLSIARGFFLSAIMNRDPSIEGYRFKFTRPGAIQKAFCLNQKNGSQFLSLPEKCSPKKLVEDFRAAFERLTKKHPDKDVVLRLIQELSINTTLPTIKVIDGFIDMLLQGLKKPHVQELQTSFDVEE